MGSAGAEHLGRLPAGATRVTATEGGRPKVGTKSGTEAGTTCLVLAIGYEHATTAEAGTMELIDQPDVHVVLVGPSGDPIGAGWAGALAQSRPAACTLVTVAAKTSKAEAVRQGLRAAVARGAAIVGYVSADFASPVSRSFGSVTSCGPAVPPS